MSTGLATRRTTGAAMRCPAPMTYQESRGTTSQGAATGRSTVGWEQFRAAPGLAVPTDCSRCCPPAAFPVTAVITQNVDGPACRRRLGPRDRPARRLTGCCSAVRRALSRAALHARMLAMNPELSACLPELRGRCRPGARRGRRGRPHQLLPLPAVPAVRRILKPDVVFFARVRLAECGHFRLRRARAGAPCWCWASSLTARRGCASRAARSRAKPVVILNDDPH